MKDIAERIKALDSMLNANPADEDALIMRGRLYWSINRRREAINDYLEAQRLNPHGKAPMLLKATYDILDYYNKDLYNP